MKYTNQYWATIKKATPFVLFVSVVLTLIAYGVASRLKPSYEVHFSYLVALQNREPASEFRYDGFYALQATDLFTATLASWTKAPEIIYAAYEDSHLKPVSEDAATLQKTVRADKTAPQLVQITVRENTPERAEALSEGLKRVMEKNVAVYNEKSVPEISFAITTGDSWDSETSVSAVVIAVSTGVLSLFIGYNIVLLLVGLKDLSAEKP